MSYSTIQKKPCKCGCGKMPTIGCRGWNFACLPVLEQIEKRNTLNKKKNEAAKRAINRKKLHEVQREVGVPISYPKSSVRQKPIPKFSSKMIENLKIYSVLRKDFLKDNPICKCGRDGCKRKATDIHHKKGRGALLNVVEFWLPVARVCHRWITDHPKEAMELGLTISRLNT